MAISYDVARSAGMLRQGGLNPLRLLLSSEPWRAALFMLLSFVLGIFWFVVLVTLISVGGSLVITFVGLPILVGTLLLVPYAARSERWRVQALLGVPIESPYRAIPEGPALKRLRAFATDSAVWQDLLYLFLLFPIGVFEFVVLMIALTVPLSLLAAPFYYQYEDASVVGYVVDSLPEALVASLVGIPILLACILLLVAVARAHVMFAQTLLGPGERAQLREQVTHLSSSRARVMDAGFSELRRIERDLHDGAQQWLVAVAIDLAIAREKLDTDPEMTREMIDKAATETRQALAELRNLVRGMSPAMLADRGLDPAISALAARCPVPVTVDVELNERLPDIVETTAYFVVAESLTNVAKHSQAQNASVVIRRVGAHLHLEISDDGVGGVDVQKGTGIAGLRDRVSAIDGELRVESPQGGPTRIVVELPCAL